MTSDIQVKVIEQYDPKNVSGLFKSSRKPINTPTIPKQSTKYSLFRNNLYPIFVTKWLPNMEARRDVFQAIADPTRRQIIHLLSKQSLSLNLIADNFDTSRPAISKHIKILEECGLIIIRQEGRERYCNVQLKKLKEVKNWAEQYSQLWDKKLGNLQEYLGKEKRAK